MASLIWLSIWSVFAGLREVVFGSLNFINFKMDVKGQRVLNLKLKYVGFAYGFLECYFIFLL